MLAEICGLRCVGLSDLLLQVFTEQAEQERQGFGVIPTGERVSDHTSPVDTRRLAEPAADEDLEAFEDPSCP